MNQPPHHHRSDLIRIAIQAMVDRGLEPKFPVAVRQQLSDITGPGRDDDPKVHDLVSLPWCSIDNDDSLDLDQLSCCEPLGGGAVKLRVTIAEVDALVAKASAIDTHAWTNTTSIYTSAQVFPMLPPRLSTDLSSLNPRQDRLALVTEMVVAPDASVRRIVFSNAADVA